MKKNDTSHFQEHVVTKMREQCRDWNSIARWFELHAQRVRSVLPLWYFTQEIQALFKLSWEDLITQLQHRYQTSMPSGIIYVKPEIYATMEKINHRHQSPGAAEKELHENLEGIKRLEENYQRMLSFIKINYPSISIITVPAYSSDSIDHIIKNILS